MPAPALARDFKEFLKLLNSNAVEFLVVGGYAIPKNAPKGARALREFGFGGAGLSANLFVQPNNVIRMGDESD